MFNVRAYLLKNQFLATLVIVCIGWLLLQIKDILLLLFVSFILVSAFAPFIKFLRSKKIPNVLAIVILYLLIIAFLALLIVPLVPFVISQFQLFLDHFPQYVKQTSQVLHLKSNTNSFANSQADSLSKNAFTLTTGIFGGVFSTLTLLVISFYLLLDHDELKHKLASLFESKDREKAIKIFAHIEERLGAWLRGQLLLSVAVALMAWVALTALGLNFALPLAILAGILEIVPMLGPILSSIPAVIVAFSISPTLALIVALVFLVIQQIENNVLVPKIMERAVGLHPVVVIIGVIIGGQLAGALGALLAVPFVSMLAILLRDSQT